MFTSKERKILVSKIEGLTGLQDKGGVYFDDKTYLKLFELVEHIEKDRTKAEILQDIELQEKIIVMINKKVSPLIEDANETKENQQTLIAKRVKKEMDFERAVEKFNLDTHRALKDLEKLFGKKAAGTVPAALNSWYDYGMTYNPRFIGKK